MEDRFRNLLPLDKAAPQVKEMANNLQTQVTHTHTPAAGLKLLSIRENRNRPVYTHTGVAPGRLIGCCVVGQKCKYSEEEVDYLTNMQTKLRSLCAGCQVITKLLILSLLVLKEEQSDQTCRSSHS